MYASTIFALASGHPPAAIALIRISGPQAHAAGHALAGTLAAPRMAAVRTLRSSAGDILDEALVLRFDGPGSSTGEDVVEFHCHGGRAVVDAVLSALGTQPGLRAAEPGEFTRRAFENGRIDLTEAEGLADLLEAETESQRKSALAMAEGGLRRQVEQWQQQVLQLSARAEAAIDYVDEDGLGLDHGLLADCAALEKELRSWLERPRAEKLRDGIRIVIAGPPNAGKSSLFNAIAGCDRAIVTDVPGTTRDQIELPISIGGMPFLLVDTAGVRDTGDRVEQIGVARAKGAVEAADVLWWLGSRQDRPPHPRLIAIHARCDVAGPAMDGELPVSSLTGEGISALMSQTSKLGKSLLPWEGSLALNRRQAGAVFDACDCLGRAATAGDIVLAAEELRSARLAFDRLSGRAGMEEVLDHLFSRFCLGK